MSRAAIRYAFFRLKKGRHVFLGLSLPLGVIFVSLKFLHFMLDEHLGVIYGAISFIYGLEFLILPILLSWFSIGWLKALVNGRSVSIPDPFRLDPVEKALAGRVLVFFFLVLNLPFLVTGLWSWLGPDTMQQWLGVKGALFGVSGLIAMFLIGQQALLFPALAEGKDWDAPEAAQAAEGVKADILFAVMPVGIALWALYGLPAQLALWLTEDGLSGAAFWFFLGAALPFQAAIAFTGAALWCGIAVYFYRRVSEAETLTPPTQP